MTRTLELREMQESLQELVTRVKSGTEIILTENRLPVARIVSTESEPAARKRVAGLHRGAMRMSADFDEPLPDSLWIGEG